MTQSLWIAGILFILEAGLCLADDPQPVPAKEDAPSKEDPSKTIERIQQNAQQAGKRLGEKDSGQTTRKIQSDILKDIDALIRKAQEPPPSSDSNPMPPPMNKMGSSSGSSSESQPKNGSGMSQPMPNSGGSNRAGRRERKSQSDPSQPSGTGNPQPMGGSQPLGKGDQPMSSLKSNNPKGMTFRNPDVYKDVWGHLPEKMRQEMDSYYREQFIPRYSELLKQYYSAIAEQNRKP